MHAWTELHLMTVRDRIDTLRVDAAATRADRRLPEAAASRPEDGRTTANRLHARGRALLARA